MTKTKTNEVVVRHDVVLQNRGRGQRLRPLNQLFFIVLQLNVSMLIYAQLECGPMPNVMVALPNTGGALCSMPQSLADAHY